MANSNVPMFAQTVQNWAVQILPADTTTKKSLVVGGTQGSKVEMINIYSTDTAAMNVILYLFDGTTSFPLSTFTVPAGSGNTGTVVSFNIFSSTQVAAIPYDSNGNKYLYVKAGWTLQASVVATVTTAKAVSLVAIGGDF